MRTWLCNASIDSQQYHIGMEEGRIVSVLPSSVPVPEGESREDAQGMLLLPTFSDYHTHLDKSFVGEGWVSRPKLNHIMEMLQVEKKLQAGLRTSVLERAGQTLEAIVQAGTSRLRVHVDVDPTVGLKHLEAVLRLKETYQNKIQMEIVAFPQQGMLKSDSVRWIKEVMRSGAEMVGGVDPAGIDGDMEASLNAVFELSSEFDAAIDLHLHDPDQVGKGTIMKMIELTEQAGLSGRVAISHAYCLGELSRGEVEEIAGGLVALDIPIISSVPIDTPMPPIARLTELGVKVHLGTDHPNADSWTPFGCCDMLEKARRLAERNMWFDDHSIREAYSYIGNPPLLPVIGSPANFMLVQAASAAHALASLPPREKIYYHGKLVAGRMLR
jgi:cytosine/adenosine deaminase-related metal-dependent hydrolase